MITKEVPIGHLGDYWEPLIYLLLLLTGLY